MSTELTRNVYNAFIRLRDATERHNSGVGRFDMHNEKREMERAGEVFDTALRRLIRDEVNRIFEEANEYAKEQNDKG